MITDWILANGEPLQFGAYFLVLAGLGAAEALWPHRAGPMHRRRRWTTNLVLTVLNVAALSILPIGLIGAAVWADRHDVGLLNAIPLHAAGAAAATVLARSLLSFLTHWLMHAVPAFWRIHRVHHLDTELDVSTTVRFHPLEFVLGLLIGVPVVVTLGLTPWVLVAYEVLDAGINVWTHSNTRLPDSVDWVLRRIVVTPALHRVHHSAWKPETNSNYGAVFPWWDMVFGTYRTDTRDPSDRMVLGLEAPRGDDAHRLLALLALTDPAGKDAAPDVSDPAPGRATGAPPRAS